MSIASSVPAREADEGVEMRVEMDVDTGAGGPGQEERASPPLLKIITADSAAGPGENGMRRTSSSSGIGINSSNSSSILVMSEKERRGEQIVLDMANEYNK